MSESESVLINGFGLFDHPEIFVEPFENYFIDQSYFMHKDTSVFFSVLGSPTDSWSCILGVRAIPCFGNLKDLSQFLMLCTDLRDVAGRMETTEGMQYKFFDLGEGGVFDREMFQGVYVSCVDRAGAMKLLPTKQAALEEIKPLAEMFASRIKSKSI